MARFLWHRSRVTQPFIVSLVVVLSSSMSLSAQEATDATTAPLPFPKEFDGKQYLGKWFEIARLPSPEQPKETLAMAEYSQGEGADQVVVKNSAFDQSGKPLRTLTGKAQLMPDAPPRLKVSFGPVVPNEPNYYVLHVTPKYEIALVGTPNRKRLWLLARTPSIDKKQLDEMLAIAKQAGFPIAELIVSDWSNTNFAAHPQKLTKPMIFGSWEYQRGQKDGIERSREALKDQVVVIDEDTIHLDSPVGEFEWSYELVEKTTPQAINLTATKSPFGTGQSVEGIIQLAKGQLQLCYSPSGGERPTKFEAKAGSGDHYFVLRRRPLTADQLIGEWKFESGKIDGRVSDKNRLADSAVTITKDTLTLQSGDTSFQMSYELDGAKLPATIQLRITKGPFGQGAAASGIVKLDDGELTLCYHPRGGKAPPEFDAAEEYALFVLSKKSDE